ncbi:MAG: serine hydrolase [Dehalococcoidia bacterium]
MNRTGLAGGLIVVAVVVAACLAFIASVPRRETGARTELIPREPPPPATASPTRGLPAREAVRAPGTVGPPTPPNPRADARLQAVVAEAVGETDASVSVVVKRLTDGLSAEVEADHVYYAASLFKLAVLYEAALRLSAGTLALDDALQLTAEDFMEDLGTGGVLPSNDEGAIAVSDALEAMVTRSDNVTAVAFLHHFGGDTVDATLRGIGLRDTTVNDRSLPTTARDMAALMEALTLGIGLDDATWRYVMDLLARQEMREAVLAGIPDGVNAGAKWGAWPDDGGAGHDAGFVDGPTGTYVIAVLSDQPWGWELIARVSGAVYEELARTP